MPAPSLPRQRRSPAGYLYVLAGLVAVYGIVRMSLQWTSPDLGYLAGLAGIFTVIAAGIQQLDRRRDERREARLQAEQDSLRRFDARFAAVTRSAAADHDQRASAGAALMSFLRDGNAAFHRQTYYFLLSHLKSPRAANGDQTFVHAFECAAHLVLPELAGAGGSSPDGAQLPRPAGERRLAVDFAEAALAGVDLSRLELAEADLSYAGLDRADLSGSCLWRCHGFRASLTWASLRYANLEEAVLPQLAARGADFSCANLVAARFAARGRVFDPSTRLGRSDFRGAQFVRARLQGASFNGADLRDARFDGANLKGTSFRDALVNDAVLRTVTRSVNQSWTRASWDPAVARRLAVLAGHGRSGGPVRRGAAHDPAVYYRRHPYPHGEEENAPRRRLRLR